jgi:hypothetical protein
LPAPPHLPEVKLPGGDVFKTPRPLAAICAAALGFAVFANQAAAASCPNVSFVVVEPKASPETRPVRVGPRHTIFVRRDPITTTADLTEIKLEGDAYDTLVLLRFTPEAAQRLHDATTDKSGMRVALVADDQAISAVTWEGPYGMDANLGLQMSLGRPVPRVAALVEAVQECIGTKAR